jgi:hypothetical protein
MAFLAILLYYALNILINVLDFFSGNGQFFTMLYSIMHACIAIPLALLFMSKGYRCLAGISTELKWYKYGEIFFCFGSLMAIIFKFLCYHGLKYVFTVMKATGIIEFALGLASLIVLLANLGLRIICMYNILVVYAPKDEDSPSQ